MSDNINLTYYQKNRDVILNRAKDYCENENKTKQVINMRTSKRQI